jgi:two-component sensor histidine kinase
VTDSPEALLRTAQTASVLPPDFAAVFQAAPSPMLLMAADAPRYTMVAVNRAHAAAFRTSPELLLGFGVFEVFPDDPDPVTAGFVDMIRRSLERVMATGHADEMGVQRFSTTGPDGQPEERYGSAIHTPIRDAEGRITHIMSSVRDVTAVVKERQATEARALLIREVDHRARNALTVVQSIVRLTEAATVGAFKQVVQGRVEALARAQGSLARRKWEGAYLQEVIRAELAALAAPGAFSVEGPPTLLRPENVQAVSMIVHELATNARKYGALSSPQGRVEVTWRRHDGRLALVWQESGGPAAGAPGRHGFGSRLIGRLARQLQAKVAYDWRPEGLRLELSAPL